MMGIKALIATAATVLVASSCHGKPLKPRKKMDDVDRRLDKALASLDETTTSLVESLSGAPNGESQRDG